MEPVEATQLTVYTGDSFRHGDKRLYRAIVELLHAEGIAGATVLQAKPARLTVIRARFRLFRRVKAITAEAQWSGKFLSGFPLACLVFIQVAKPDYYDNVLDHPWFMPACFIVGIMLTLNMIVMRHLTNIKV